MRTGVSERFAPPMSVYGRRVMRRRTAFVIPRTKPNGYEKGGRAKPGRKFCLAGELELQQIRRQMHPPPQFLEMWYKENGGGVVSEGLGKRMVMGDNAAGVCSALWRSGAVGVLLACLLLSPLSQSHIYDLTAFYAALQPFICIRNPLHTIGSSVHKCPLIIQTDHGPNRDLNLELFIC